MMWPNKTGGNPYERRSFVLEIEGWFMSQVRGA